ncbi:Two-component system response regulator [Propionibacterium freudenreichii]|uniref:response regulator n=1 Tax=Propionibacterium freudenreichii TaxID=1744 RepID=UPI000BC2D0C4|nr:response regulator transcription factor [Propionibacterium freudenreichii]MDK9332092.1 response regulator transcription factor [Propionibacterium freudenreichii]SBT28927.1 Two-component system response regulator [Propionibacterium freudenreichii]
MIRVLLADDQTMVRTGFEMILGVENDIEVVGQAADGRQAVSAAARLHPDVVLMDVQMPTMDGIAATREIVAAETARVIVLTTFDRDDYLFDALGAGASGFILKNSDPTELVAAVRAVANGDALLSPSVTLRVIRAMAQGHAPREVTPGADAELARLTDREVEVLRALARGLSNAEITAELFVSEATVKTHVSNVLSKLGLRDRVQAVAHAYQHGLVS